MHRDKQRDVARRLIELREAKSTQLAPDVWRNPVAAYTDAARFAGERELLRHHPTVVCLSCDVAAPGSYVATETGGVPIAVIRGDDGVLRGFVNICRHRASVPIEGCGSGARSFACGFHGWVYGLDGRLQAQPHSCGGYDSLDRTQLGLRPISVAERAGLVFARLGGEPIDLEAVLCGVDREIADFGLESYHRFGESWTSSWRCNYKLIIDTFLEPYHVFALHRKSVARYYLTSPSAFDGFGPHLRYHSLQKNFDEMAALPEDEWDLARYGTIEYVLSPNTVLSHSVDHMAVYRFLPQSVDTTRVELVLYTPQPVVTDEDRAHFARTLALHRKVAGDEDFVEQERIQRALDTGLVDETIFGRNEPAAIHYHHQLNRLLATQVPSFDRETR